MRPVPAVLALAAAGCAQGQPAASCASANLPSAARAMPAILALAETRPDLLEAGFVLCSRHRDRLIAASSALGQEGYSSYIGADDRGQCLRVARTHEASVAALEREMARMCRIADEHGIAYRHWQAEVGGKSVRLAGGRLRVDGQRVR